MQNYTGWDFRMWPLNHVAASGFCYKKMYERFAGPKKVDVKKR